MQALENVYGKKCRLRMSDENEKGPKSPLGMDRLFRPYSKDGIGLIVAPI